MAPFEYLYHCLCVFGQNVVAAWVQKSVPMDENRKWFAQLYLRQSYRTLQSTKLQSINSIVLLLCQGNFIAEAR